MQFVAEKVACLGDKLPVDDIVTVSDELSCCMWVPRQMVLL